MHVTYKPEDGDRQEWDIDFDRVRTSQAQIIERAFDGKTWDEFKIGVQSGNAKARRVLLWHLMTRDHPMMRFDDTPDFYTGELVTEYSVKELTVLRDGVNKVPEDKREQFLTTLDIELTEAMAREERTAEGKALSPTSPTTGGWPSPQS